MLVALGESVGDLPGDQDPRDQTVAQGPVREEEPGTDPLVT